MAIAEELRKLHPDLEIDWLAQHPVTAVLEAAGERIHPASALLANESATSRASRPSTTCTASRRSGGWTRSCSPTSWSSTTSCARSTYDLWIGDEAWELDYYLHENPEQKRPPYVWLTDFVGWLPMPDGGDHEAFLTADYNDEMIEHIARFPRIRDRAVFVGNPEDIVPDSFGAELPAIRDWTEQHYEFAGYVTGFEPVADRATLAARARLRRRTSRSASSPSAAPASAATSCAA